MEGTDGTRGFLEKDAGDRVRSDDYWTNLFSDDTGVSTTGNAADGPAAGAPDESARDMTGSTVGASADVAARAAASGTRTDTVSFDGISLDNLSANDLTPDQYERVMQTRKRIERILARIDGVPIDEPNSESEEQRAEFEAWHKHIEDSSFFDRNSNAPTFEMPKTFLRRSSR